MRPMNRAWIAGILEGEGSFNTDHRGRGIRVRVQMTDEDIIRRVADIVGAGTVRPCKASSLTAPNQKQLWRWDVNASNALALIQEIRPLMGSRRRSQIDRMIAARIGQHQPTLFGEAGPSRRRHAPRATGWGGSGDPVDK